MTPFTSVAPLVFVVVVTMIKQVGQNIILLKYFQQDFFLTFCASFQGYEDFLRHKGDRAINTAKVRKTLKNCFCSRFENFCSGEGFEGGEGGVSAESGYQGGQEIC